MSTGCRCDEAGFTLTEVLVSSVLTLLVLVMGYQVLTATRSTASTVTYRAMNAAAAKEAIDDLDSDLRFANGVWVCGAATSPVTCTVPSSAASTRLVVSNLPGGTQPTCAVWTVTSSGLVRTVNGASTTVTLGASDWSGGGTGTSSGFSQPLANGLIEIDLTVNQEPAYEQHAADSVTVHDLVYPDNLTDSSAATAPCA